MPKSRPVISINPRTALIDEKVSVVITGLKPQKLYRISASQTDDSGVRWISECSFLGDDKGKVNLATSVPISGSYEDADQMGLFWSMKPDLTDSSLEQNFANQRLDPITCDISVFDGNKHLATNTLERLRISPGVERISVEEDGLYGSLFLPEIKSVQGVVIKVSGSGGGHDLTKSALLASHGIPTLSLAYFGAGELPKELREIPLEYFKTSINWLKNHDRINAENVAIVGQSRGGELSLLLGSRLEEIAAVIAFVPNCFVCGSFGADPEDVGAAWTFEGKGIPYFSSALAKEIGPKLSAAWKEGGIDGCADLVMSEPALKEVLIPVEKIEGPILILSGEADRIWASKFYADLAVTILDRTGHPYFHRHHYYERCGHFFPMGYLPTTVLSVVHPIGGRRVEYGGEPKTVSAAGIDAWLNVRKFILKALA